MRSNRKAFLVALVLLSFAIVAQPMLAVSTPGTSGGVGIFRWVELKPAAGNASLNMSVPEEITNESATVFVGNAIYNTTGTVVIYVGININGTNAYSGAVTVQGNNTTKRVTVTFPADVLDQGDNQSIDIVLKVGDNATVDSDWSGTINVTTQFDVLTIWMTSIVVQIVGVILIIAVISVVFKMFKKFPTA